MSKQEIKQVKPQDLIPYAKNSRTHTDAQIKQVMRSIEEFGFTNPILLHKNTILAGHCRVEAAKRLGIKTVPCLSLDYLTPDQARAYVIADNKLAMNAGWDDDVLKQEIEDLLKADFDISLIGFDTSEFKDLGVESFAPEFSGDPDDVPEVPQNVHGVERGDIWQLGEHRLMCGDSTDVGDVRRLMDKQRVTLIHTDPPYNVDYSNADRPKAGKIDFGKIKNDIMPVGDFRQFIANVFTNAWAASEDDASLYCWYASRMSIPTIEGVEVAGWSFSQQVIWKKPMLLGRSRYQWSHEPCIFGVKGSPYFTDDRTKTTVWDFGGYDKSKNVHPTQKPVVIPEEAINNSCPAGGKVLDLFGGSGSTLIACEKTGRKCYMMEIDEHYCSVIIERWQQFTGKKAEKIA